MMLESRLQAVRSSRFRLKAGLQQMQRRTNGIEARALDASPRSRREWPEGRAGLSWRAESHDADRPAIVREADGVPALPVGRVRGAGDEPPLLQKQEHGPDGVRVGCGAAGQFPLGEGTGADQGGEEDELLQRRNDEAKQRDAQAEAMSRTAQYLVGGGTLLALLLVGGAGLLLTRSVTAPVREAVAQLGSAGALPILTIC